MKRAPILFLTIAILFGLDATPILGAQPGNVTIQYVSPEKFSDFRIYGTRRPLVGLLFRRPD